ncbi:MAG: hypothetical protein KJ623_03135 [Nanoarchaeota archaeon]|nr:hypothetical protein [Nanoarchaeota archaeon]MBU0962906.1 hypothetical protein [Nanoarchaeota archaeon]
MKNIKYERQYPLDVLAQIEAGTIDLSFNEYEENLDPRSSGCDSKLSIREDSRLKKYKPSKLPYSFQ